jgi:hypothetical protein
MGIIYFCVLSQIKNLDSLASTHFSDILPKKSPIKFYIMTVDINSVDVLEVDIET